MLYRLREAMGGDDEGKLSGIVKIDEAYFGGLEGNKHESKKIKAGRGVADKQAVLGMRERGGTVKAKPIKSTNQKTLQSEVHKSVEAGSTTYTDEHRGYLGLDGLWFKHGTVKHGVKEFVNDMAHTNGIESVWAVIKRGCNGVYHHWSTKHLERYVDEFSFRLNAGNCQIDTMDKIASLALGGVGKRLTLRGLVGWRYFFLISSLKKLRLSPPQKKVFHENIFYYC